MFLAVPAHRHTTLAVKLHPSPNPSVLTVGEDSEPDPSIMPSVNAPFFGKSSHDMHISICVVY
jgi:hypothetical protein